MAANDANNWIIPTDSDSYTDYTTARSSVLSLLSSDLAATNLLDANGLPYTDADGHSYSFHPACAGLRTLFNQGKLAPILNVGTLVFPLTKATYQANSVARPPQLFSHSDQVTQWQTSIPDQPPLTGWGGRCADLLQSVNPQQRRENLTRCLPRRRQYAGDRLQYFLLFSLHRGCRRPGQSQRSDR